MNAAHCFLCGARITVLDLRYEDSKSQPGGGAVVTRRYECSMCAATHEVSGFVTGAASTLVRCACCDARVGDARPPYCQDCHDKGCP